MNGVPLISNSLPSRSYAISQTWHAPVLVPAVVSLPLSAGPLVLLSAAVVDGSVVELDPGSVGSVVELDRKIGEAIDIYVNNRLVARGEVVVVDDRLGVTMTEIIKDGDAG